MISLTPYLFFDGNCQQAMEFYKSCMGGELTAIKVKDSPAKEFMPEILHEKTLNASLMSGSLQFSASDWCVLDRSPIPGNTVCLYLNGGTFGEMENLFGKLAEGGEVTHPLKEQFFGIYGALTDKFGVHWMFRTDKKG